MSSAARPLLAPDSPLADMLAALEAAPAAIAYLHGPEHLFTWANPVFEEVVGRKVLGKTIREALPELEGQPFFGLLDGVYATGEPFRADEMLALLVRDGTGTPSESYWNFVYQPVRTDGRITGILVHAVEVTELVTRRREAEALQKRFQDLVQGLPDTIVWEADAATVDFHFVSPSAEALLGYPVSDWYTEKPNFWVNHLHPEDRERCVSFCLQETAQGRDHEFDYRMIARDGRVVWLRDRAYCVRDESGKVTKLRGLMVDVTARKEQEDEIRRLNAELEARVEARTAELRSALRELEAFSYSVSHDLRAPVRHISGFADLLERHAAGALDDKARRHLATIREAAGHAGQLVDDLLAFSRMGRSELRHSRLDMAALVREVIADVKTEGEGRPIEWKVGELPAVTGDPAMIRLVWRNLLANAVKFTRGREPAVIEIDARHEGAAGRIVYRVKDNGSGFDMRYKDKLFGVFQRLHSVEDFEGTGIGLANVRRIVERHGGEVSAEGVLGEGATFSFALPVSPRGA